MRQRISISIDRVKSKQKISKALRQNFNLSFDQISYQRLPTNLQKNFIQCKNNIGKIFKFVKDPHCYIKIFYYNFLKLYFVSNQYFHQKIEKLFSILDDDNFKIFVPEDKNSLYHMDWTSSKFKRMLVEYFNEISNEDYRDVGQIFEKKEILHKIFLLLFFSIILYCDKCSKFQEFISFQIVNEVLINYFQIEITEIQDLIEFTETGALVCNQNNKQVYLLITQKIEAKNDQFFVTSQSLSLNSNSSQSSGIQNLNFQFISSNFVEQSLKESKEKLNLQSFQSQQYRNEQHLDFDQQKTKRFHYSMNQYNQKSDNIWTERQYGLEEQQKNNFFYSSQGMKSTVNSSNLTKLSDLINHRANTQQSIDDSISSNQDQYSFIEEQVLTMKKINDKKLSKQYIDYIQNYSESFKRDSQSLISKLYQFQKLRKNKPSKFERKYSNFKTPLKKVQLKKNVIEEMNQKPDFKKVKMRKRKVQQSNVQSKEKDQKNTSTEVKQFNVNTIKKQKIQKKQDKKELLNPLRKLNQVDQCMKISKKENQIVEPINIDEIENRKMKSIKQFILINPRKRSSKQNVYSKFGYLNMDISNEFTDSLILKQLDENTKQKVKQMKQKARQQRDSIKNRLDCEDC